MKRDTTRLRLNKMLSDDREDMNEATKTAAHTDFTRVAREYFDTDNVVFSVKRGKSGIDVTVSFRAARVKNFTTLK